MPREKQHTHAGAKKTSKHVPLACTALVSTGSLAIPLALRGASVSASDISAAMAGEAQERYNAAVAAGQAAPAVAPKFEALDLE